MVRLVRREERPVSDEQLKQDVEKYVEEVWEDVVEDIRSLVRIDSVEDLAHAESGKPWGPGPYRALVKGLELAERAGLEPHNCDGYIGYADLPGRSEKQIATIAHTDIVPVGIGWTVPALDVTRREGYLLGRGVLDDKGPFVLSVYAAKYFADQVRRTGEPLPYTLRCIVGNNEETSMADVEWYLENFEAPDFLFTPDADFPLICGEKGIFHGLFTTKAPVVKEESKLVELDGGTVANAIPGLATAKLKTEGVPVFEYPGSFELEGDVEGLTQIVSHGVGGHAAFPEGTVNAIGQLSSLLLDLGVTADDEGLDSFVRMVNVIANTSDGAPLGIASSDKVFGALTMNAGVIRTQSDGTMTITMDVRYPTSIAIEDVVAAFEDLAEKHGCTFESGMAHPPFYMDPSLPAIQALLETYREYVDPAAEPFVIGGGTYARHFPRACAFGPHDPSIKDPEWVGIEHGPDEGVSEECLKRALKIYIVSIARLMELDL
jgi:succinyl-diaminopimelate desuccinylase